MLLVYYYHFLWLLIHAHWGLNIFVNVFLWILVACGGRSVCSGCVKLRKGWQFIKFWLHEIIFHFKVFVFCLLLRNNHIIKFWSNLHSLSFDLFYTIWDVSHHLCSQVKDFLYFIYSRFDIIKICWVFKCLITIFWVIKLRCHLY